MADKYTPERATSGKERLRTWWKKVENNFVKIFGAVSKHIDGTADRHTADMIDYSDTETVKARLDSTDTKLDTKVDKVSGKGLVDAKDIRTAVQNGNLKFADGKKVEFTAPSAESVNYSCAIDGDGIAMQNNGGKTKIEIGEVLIDQGGNVHILSEKANAADLENKVDKVSGKGLIDEAFANDISYYSSSKELIINGDSKIQAKTLTATDVIYCEGDVVSYKGDVTATILDEQNGTTTKHKLSEKANAADVGALSDLTTTDKSSVVAAINEVKASGGGMTDAEKEVMGKLSLDESKSILYSSANIWASSTLGTIGGFEGRFNHELKVGNLGNDSWAFVLGDTAGFSSRLDVTTYKNGKVHKLSEKANASTVLTKTNTTAFTPTADYHPATKKYVDDLIAALRADLGLE